MQRVLVAWSSGKDSAWMLSRLVRDATVEVAALMTTFDERRMAVSMHGIPRTLVAAQAQAAGLPLWPVPLPWPCPNEVYAARMRETVDRARAEGYRVSSLHLRFLSPLEPGLPEIFARFDQVITVEINYSDPAGTPGRTHAQLATLLRSELLLDVDCWSVVHGQPIRPGLLLDEIARRCPKEVQCSA